MENEILKKLEIVIENQTIIYQKLMVIENKVLSGSKTGLNFKRAVSDLEKDRQKLRT